MTKKSQTVTKDCVRHIADIGMLVQTRSAYRLKLDFFRRERMKPYGYTVFSTALEFVA